MIDDALRLIPKEGTYLDSETEYGRLKVYESSLVHYKTLEPLLSIYAERKGIRLTKEQATQLMFYLNEWIGDE